MVARTSGDVDSSDEEQLVPQNVTNFVVTKVADGGEGLLLCLRKDQI